jgi:hypothetical protein
MPSLKLGTPKPATNWGDYTRFLLGGGAATPTSPVADKIDADFRQSAQPYWHIDFSE